MQVLMLGWELPPHNSGGLGVACYQLCKTLSKKGAKVTFVVPYTAEHTLDFMNVVSAKLASPKSIFGVYDQLSGAEAGELEGGNILQLQEGYAKAIEPLALESNFHVIHAHDWLTFRAGLRARELSGKPLILHVHSVESDRAGDKAGNPIVHEIEALGLLLADRIIAVSELTKQRIIRDYDIPPAKITVAHNSIDVDVLPELDSDNSYTYLQALKSTGYKVVANVGRLTVQKGLTHLLLAAQKVIEKRPKTMFLIVGSGEQYRELLQLGADLGISQNLLFTGFQRGKQWRDAFGIADLFVMPSVSEPFGLTPLEATVYDTPSLISKQSGVSEVLKNCLKVDFWDIDKMADSIISVLEHEGLHAALLQNARNEFVHLSWDKTAHTLMEVYATHAEVPA